MRVLVRLGRMFGRCPDEIAKRPWSVLLDWIEAADE